jgi:hypothetical protein
MKKRYTTAERFAPDPGNPRKKHRLEDVKTDANRRRILIEQRGHRCEGRCGLSLWYGVLIPLELEHVDGCSDNNAESNLKLLCPNCHALTPHYKGANKGNSKRQVERRSRYAEGKTF